MSNDEAMPTGPAQEMSGDKPAGLPEDAPAGVPGAAPAAPAESPGHPARAEPDPVEEAGWESFPASDPPAWTGTGVG